jgi:hypothetical protein
MNEHLNQHLNDHLDHDEFILAYYGEPGLGVRREHLADCADCTAELTRLAAVLDRVTPGETPEPSGDYEARMWQRLEWRLAAETRPEPVSHGPLIRTRSITRWLAAAAAVAVAFVAGLLISRSERVPQQIASTKPAATAVAAPAASTGVTEQQRDRILLVVVGDHIDDSERVLVELTNLTPNGKTDITSERERAEELLASNRLYRRTALDRGEEQMATLLDELEPVLLQIAHAPAQVSPEELRSMQKRVEAKGIVFKLRVVRADVRNDRRAPAANHLQQPSI